MTAPPAPFGPPLVAAAARRFLPAAKTSQPTRILKKTASRIVGMIVICERTYCRAIALNKGSASEIRHATDRLHDNWSVAGLPWRLLILRLPSSNGGKRSCFCAGGALLLTHPGCGFLSPSATSEFPAFCTLLSEEIQCFGRQLRSSHALSYMGS